MLRIGICDDNAMDRMHIISMLPENAEITEYTTIGEDCEKQSD